ncbi:hypothetical protein LIPSTDRAFT_68694 [Lipomyces starkeyi NRRL Y-11557]|uniref:Uncharacterized protein n=1 Tax=Lipomyces starkeyi NRRL Y-11557 TaxID=675824 RepID=A0A1E3QEU9_LIPST|nr:hypothetical protein LIPSTDRAFT_68694 [Lipomyces starkeyi NRRL Y-11557]
MITAKYPPMLGIGCALHQFNLTFKDILSIETLKCILDEDVEMSKMLLQSPFSTRKLEAKAEGDSWAGDIARTSKQH